MPHRLDISLESLRIANATLDLLAGNRGRIAMLFAREARFEHLKLSSSDATFFAAELVELLHSIAATFSTGDSADLDGKAGRLSAEPAAHDEIVRAFGEAFRLAVARPGSAMIGNAWCELLAAYLAWTAGKTI